MILYRIIVNIAHVFRAFNFRTIQAVRKYFNNKIFAIYGISMQRAMLPTAWKYQTTLICFSSTMLLTKDFGSTGIA